MFNVYDTFMVFLCHSSIIHCLCQGRKEVVKLSFWFEASHLLWRRKKQARYERLWQENINHRGSILPEDQ